MIKIVTKLKSYRLPRFVVPSAYFNGGLTFDNFLELELFSRKY